MGIDSTEFLNYFSDNNKAWFPIVYGDASLSGIRIQQIPYARTLKRDSNYEFQFTASPDSKIAIINKISLLSLSKGNPFNTLRAKVRTYQ